MALLLTLIALRGIVLLLVTFHMFVTHARTLHTMTRSAEDCPVPCSCYNSTVVCNSMNLKEVPLNLPSRTKALYLNDNMITTLDFRLIARLNDLEELYLQGNKLTGIDENDIEFLPSLKHVDLRENPLVCDCPLAEMVDRTLDNSLPLDVILGDTKCVIPMQGGKGKASDVLKSLKCRHRSRRGEQGQCHPLYCNNGGTCIDGLLGPYCECPDSHSGVHCERSTPDDVLIFLDDITPNSVKVSWKASLPVIIDRYYVTLQEQSPYANIKHFWTEESYYIFVRLSPGEFYEVCVTGHTNDGDDLEECCKQFATYPYPSYPGPDHSSRHPPGHTHEPESESKDRESAIHQAAVILGSIIGVCAFFIIFLTLVYKFRTLRNSMSWGGGRGRRSPSPPEDDGAEAETEFSQDSGSDNNAGRINSAISQDNESDSAAADPGPVLPTPDHIPINRVLRAYHPPTARGSHEAPSTNTVVLYRPENRGMVEDLTALSRDNPSGTAPIFIVADGSHFPLNPALSQALCSAMSRQTVPRGPLPDEPPPPYSEVAEEVHPTLASIPERTDAESVSDEQNDSDEQNETVGNSSDETQDRR